MIQFCEIYDSIQREGLYIGKPVRFVVFSGCNLKCKYCKIRDRESHSIGDEGLLLKITENEPKTIVLTGGEPLSQWVNIKKTLIKLPPKYRIHLETNGTFDLKDPDVHYFESIMISPKLPSAGGSFRGWPERMKYWKRKAKGFIHRTQFSFKFIIFLFHFKGIIPCSSTN